MRHHLTPVLATRAFDRGHHELEVLGAVIVRHDEEAVALVGRVVVLDVVLDAGPARRHYPQLALGIVGILNHASLVIFDPMETTKRALVRVRPTDV